MTEDINRVADVLVLGAGASGLAFAGIAARSGIGVRVIDHSARVARKVLASGGGHCNVTNMNAGHTHYAGENPDFTRSALARFTPRDTLEWLGGIPLSWEERTGGRVFLTESAALLAAALEREALGAGAEIVLNAPIRGARLEGGLFHAETGRGEFIGRRLVVATGGRSWKGIGASTVGYDIARGFGHRVTDLRPALVPMIAGEPLEGLQGISFAARVGVDGFEFEDDVLVTHKGLSGPAILQASMRWRRGMSITLNLLPGIDAHAWLSSNRSRKIELKGLIAERLPRRLAERIAELAGGSSPMNSLSKERLNKAAALLSALEVRPTRTAGFDEAEVTLGGVDTKEVSSKTMESRLVEGLYFIGEVLDVTGELGGYNLQWAWASAHAAAEGISRQ